MERGGELCKSYNAGVGVHPCAIPFLTLLTLTPPFVLLTIASEGQLGSSRDSSLVREVFTK